MGKMKVNVACPNTGMIKNYIITEEARLSALYGQRLLNIVDSGILKTFLTGSSLKVVGGHDKNGFSMKQGVLLIGRVRLLLLKGEKCFKGKRCRKGENRRKSIRGCIVSEKIATLNMVTVKMKLNYVSGHWCKIAMYIFYSNRKAQIRTHLHNNYSYDLENGNIPCNQENENSIKKCN